MRTFEYLVVIQPRKSGEYRAWLPAWPSVFFSGRTVRNVVRYLRDELRERLMLKKTNGVEPPRDVKRPPKHIRDLVARQDIRAQRSPLRRRVCVTRIRVSV